MMNTPTLMRSLCTLALGAGLALAAGGCSTTDIATPADEEPQGGAVALTATIGQSTGTRTDLTESNGMVKANWITGDGINIYIEADPSVPPVTFTFSKHGDDGVSGIFTSDKEPASADLYVAIYPSTVTVDGDKVSLDMTGQTQKGDGKMSHLGAYDMMIGPTKNWQSITFVNEGRSNALMTFDLQNIPADLGTPRSITLGCTAAKPYFYSNVNKKDMVPTLKLKLDDFVAHSSPFSIKAYLMMVGNTKISAGESLTITVEGDGGAYIFTSPQMVGDKIYDNGMRYTAEVDMATATPVIAYDDTAPASSTYSGGNGMADTSPFLISTSGDLKKLIDDTDSDGKYFKLTRDITLADGKTWTPIGTLDKPFKGHFDGGGHTISGEMTGAATELGFFGRVEEATITNLHTSAKVTATLTDDGSECAAGAIVGDALNSTISYCTNTGPVAGTTYVGGIVGANEGCILINCVNTGAVTSTNSLTYAAGGIGGYSDSPTIIGCGNTGSVQAKFAGGIVGYLDVGGTIRGCFNTGLITLVEGPSIGAIVGLLGDETSSILSHCQYVHAATQPAGLAACGNYADEFELFANIAKCADVSALNAAVSILNAGIAMWTPTAGLPTCFPFKAGIGSTPPVADIPGT